MSLHKHEKIVHRILALATAAGAHGVYDKFTHSAPGHALNGGRANPGIFPLHTAATVNKLMDAEEKGTTELT